MSARLQGRSRPRPSPGCTSTRSYDPADFAGARRPRGGVAVHAAAPAARPATAGRRAPERHRSTSVEPAPEVTVWTARTRRPAARRGLRADGPGERAGVRSVRPRRPWSRVPAEARRPRPTVVTVRGDGSRGGRVRAPAGRGRRRSPRPWSCSTTRAAPPTPTTSSSSSVTARRSTWSACRTGPTTRCTCRTTTPRLGRDATARAHRGHAAAATWCGSPRRSATAAPAATPSCTGLYFADAGQHLEHRLFVDHDVPRLPQPRAPTRARCRARTRTRSGSATC